jgi:hypothetical protein
LVDFSRAWTVPHPSLEHVGPSSLKAQLRCEPEGLQGMVVDWGWEIGGIGTR